jgi:hypothetical protein
MSNNIQIDLDKMERVQNIMDEKQIPFDEAVSILFAELIQKDLVKLNCMSYGRYARKSYLYDNGTNKFNTFPLSKPIPADEIDPEKGYTIECGLRSWFVPGKVLLALDKHFT